MEANFKKSYFKSFIYDAVREGLNFRLCMRVLSVFERGMKKKMELRREPSSIVVGIGTKNNFFAT